MGQFPLTLGRFITQKQTTHPGASGEFSSLLAQIGLVGKLIAQDLRCAGLIDILGTTGAINVQGETVKKLDEIANETFMKVFDQSGLVCALAVLTYIIASHVMHQRRHPTAAIAWVLFILLMPYVALPAFLLFGSRKRARSRPAPSVR